MLINIGHYSLIILLLNTIIILLIPFFKNKYIIIRKDNLLKIISIQQIISTIILISLMYSYIISDFSIKNIKENTHITLPLLYKISALWGNHEGSILLWCFLLIFYIFLVTLISHDLSINILFKYIYIQSFISLFFILFTLLTSNPFLFLYIYNINGSELNPILQDAVLAIHPPFIYLGYIGSSICYAMVLIILIENKIYKILKRYIHINILITWSFLTIGLLLGSWWSYYELGWGGWWFWDPVENAALLPWLLLLMLIHTIKQESLINWTILLSIFSFIFSLLGTFFVRSGILVSVHSFVVDYYRGFFIFSFLIIIVLISLYLYFLNRKRIYKYTYFKYTYYDNYILLNNIILLVIFMTVLIGTILPTIFSFFFNTNISIGISFYNYILTPILIPLFLLMFLSIYIKNYQFTISFLLPILFIFFIYKIEASYIYFFILLLLFLLLISLILYVYHYRFINSMIISHFGVFIFFIGVFISNIMYIDSIQIMFPGDEVILNNHIFNLRSINYIIGSNYYSLYGNVSLINKNNIINILFPEKRYYFIKGTYITKSIIYSNYFSDVYAIIGDGNYTNGWYTKFYYRPLISFIWIGPLFFIIGALYSLYKIILFKYRQFIFWY